MTKLNRTPAVVFTTRQLARYLGVSTSLLEKARCRNIGPAYHKIGKSIRYSEIDVRDWLDRQRHTPGEEQQ